MRAILGALVVLGLAAEARAKVTLRNKHGDVTTALTIAVLEPVSTPGLAEVRYTVTVEGGPGLEVEPAKVEEAIAAWQVESTRYAWLQDGRLTLTERTGAAPGQAGPGAGAERFSAVPRQCRSAVGKRGVGGPAQTEVGPGAGPIAGLAGPAHSVVAVAGRCGRSGRAGVEFGGVVGREPAA